MSRTILITGCSSGIGLDAAERLKARGWRVFATCRSAADAARLSVLGFESFRLDYEDPASVADGANEAIERAGGSLDALFNNGAYAIPGCLEDVPTEALRQIFEANFFGWHDLTRRVLPGMRRARKGRIVQCSSVLGFTGLRFRGAYVATKHALEGYSDVLRLELRHQPIHVSLIEPGPIRTRIRENARAHYERWIDKTGSPWSAQYEVLEQRLYAENPPPDFGELSCAAVSAKLIHALESPRPRARYRVTTPTRIAAVLRRALPTRALDSILARS